VQIVSPTAPRPHTATKRSDSVAGITYSAAAYCLWGLFPIYFKAVSEVPEVEVLAHRIVWSLLFLAVITAVRRTWRSVGDALTSRRLLFTLCASAATIALNWGVFIWAVAQGRILECSLGYFINPLVSIALGVVVLGERLRTVQWVAVALAAIGVAHQIAVVGSVPWIALTLACSFGGYGLLRKTAPVEPVNGLFIEAILLTPAAAAFLILTTVQGESGVLTDDWHHIALLASAGPITALPLILFVAGARRIRLATVGLLQYIAPTGHFLLAVAVYSEPLSASVLATFGCIWAGLALYTLDALRRGARR
jgi:chloramphenicol-sensitive protein RarD